MTMVRMPYSWKGMEWMTASWPASAVAKVPKPTTRPATYTPQEVKGRVMQTGAEVQSHSQASFSRETLALSVMGRITLPTNKGEK